MPTDFIDNDLLKPGPQSAPGAHDAASTPSQYERRKRLVEESESRAADELDRMRKRSEEIERRRQLLRALRTRHAEFDRSHKELSEGLKRHAVLLKDEEEQASRAATLCHETRRRFETLLDELERIDADAWTDESHESDLTQALAQIEAARAVFRKGVDRVAALGWRPERGQRAGADDPLLDHATARRSFGEWVTVGVALSLPLAVVLLAILAVCLYFWGPPA